MMGLGHRLVAASVALAVPIGLARVGLAHIDPGQVMAAALAAQPFAAGPLSPDADHTWLKRFGHRRGVHGWWWPALAALGLALSPFATFYACWGPIIGWGSHLFPADWFFGKRGRSIPRGIPVLPFCRRRTGMGWRVTRRPKFWDRWFTPRRGGHAIGELVTTGAMVPLLGWLVLTLVR